MPARGKRSKPSGKRAKSGHAKKKRRTGKSRKSKGTWTRTVTKEVTGGVANFVRPQKRQGAKRISNKRFNKILREPLWNTIPHNAGGSGLPNVMRCEQLFVGQGYGSSGTATLMHTFRLNSTYDPDYTGVGGQPRGRDLVANLYNRYLVMAAKVMLKFRNVSDPEEIICWVVIDTNAAGSTDYDTIPEVIDNPKFKKIQLAKSDATSEYDRGEMRLTVYPRKLLATAGTSGSPYGEYGTSAIGGNPTQPLYMHVYCQQPDLGWPAAGACKFDVEIMYDTVYYTLKNPQDS